MSASTDTPKHRALGTFGEEAFEYMKMRHETLARVPGGDASNLAAVEGQFDRILAERLKSVVIAKPDPACSDSDTDTDPAVDPVDPVNPANPSVDPESPEAPNPAEAPEAEPENFLPIVRDPAEVPKPEVEPEVEKKLD